MYVIIVSHFVPLEGNFLLIVSKVISYMTVTTTNVLGLLSVFLVFFVTSDIFSINELTLILKMTGQGDVKHVT